MNYYNEYDPYAASWLENLIKKGLIANGVVDTRSIKDVQPEDLKEFNQCHFFAGIGVWSYALRQAGVDDDDNVWTGSCPCQPFSSAGQGKGIEDERHLWPDFFRLIETCRPNRIMGEQVASKDGLAWLDLVYSDLERTGHTVRAVDTCAAGFGAPHIRQRLYWVADTNNPRPQGGLSRWENSEREDKYGYLGRSSPISRMADTTSTGLEVRAIKTSRGSGQEFRPERLCPTNGFWREVDWLNCSDGKQRPVRPGSFPLAHGAPSRVGRLRAYGNAINTQQAIGFIESLYETS